MVVVSTIGIRKFYLVHQLMNMSLTDGVGHDLGERGSCRGGDGEGQQQKAEMRADGMVCW